MAAVQSSLQSASVFFSPNDLTVDEEFIYVNDGEGSYSQYIINNETRKVEQVVVGKDGFLERKEMATLSVPSPDGTATHNVPARYDAEGNIVPFTAYFVDEAGNLQVSTDQSADPSTVGDEDSTWINLGAASQFGLDTQPAGIVLAVSSEEGENSLVIRQEHAVEPDGGIFDKDGKEVPAAVGDFPFTLGTAPVELVNGETRDLHNVPVNADGKPFVQYQTGVVNDQTRLYAIVDNPDPDSENKKVYIDLGLASNYGIVGSEMINPNPKTAENNGRGQNTVISKDEGPLPEKLKGTEVVHYIDAGKHDQPHFTGANSDTVIISELGWTEAGEPLSYWLDLGDRGPDGGLIGGTDTVMLPGSPDDWERIEHDTNLVGPDGKEYGVEYRHKATQTSVKFAHRSVEEVEFFTPGPREEGAEESGDDVDAEPLEGGS